jgi:hypothetical protein
MTKILLAALLAASASVNAAVIRWELRDVSFDDGATATGFFEFDPYAGAYYPFLKLHEGKIYDFDVHVSGGDRPSYDLRASNSSFRRWQWSEFRELRSNP